MTLKSKLAAMVPSSMSRSVPTPVVVAVTVIGLLLLVLWGTLSLGVEAREKSPSEKAVDARIESLAKQSGNDLSKLSEEDRHWLQNVTQGHGAFAMKHTGHNK